MTLPPISGIAELAHLGVIRATGDDAVTFLQGQLTQDVALMNGNEARLAAFCKMPAALTPGSVTMSGCVMPTRSHSCLSSFTAPNSNWIWVT